MQATNLTSVGGVVQNVDGGLRGRHGADLVRRGAGEGVAPAAAHHGARRGRPLTGQRVHRTRQVRGEHVLFIGIMTTMTTWIRVTFHCRILGKGHS